MKEEKRKARNKLSKKVDITLPLPFEKLGSSEDPCFGKHYSPKAPECQRCGDSEICASIMGQSLNFQRIELEAKSTFKDIQEPDPKADKEVRIAVKKRFKELIKNQKEIARDALINEVHSIFFDRGYTHQKLEKILDRLIERNKYISEKQNKIIWKKP